MSSLQRGVDMKEKEEVSEYLENLGIEYRFGCYKEKKPKVCHLLGDYMSEVVNDRVAAYRTYKTNCDRNGFGNSCHMVASWMVQGKVPESEPDNKLDFAKADKYFERGCENGQYRSCVASAWLKFREQIVVDPKITKRDETIVVDLGKKDIMGGMKLLHKSCDQGDDAEGCGTLSKVYHMGALDADKEVIKANPELSYKYAEKACELDAWDACGAAAEMLKSGFGTAVDLEKAKKYQEIFDDAVRTMEGKNEQVKFGEGNIDNYYRDQYKGS